MDIKHLEYFITIVENNFNLSQSAKILLISQPALTKFIKEFEEREDVELFVRSKWRLIDLTPLGKEFYENSCLDQNHQNKELHCNFSSNYNIKTDAFECAVDEYAACGEESINPNSREVLIG